VAEGQGDTGGRGSSSSSSLPYISTHRVGITNHSPRPERLHAARQPYSHTAMQPELTGACLSERSPPRVPYAY
jgi:hypothetical protein